MQTVPPTLRLAVAAMVSIHCNGRFNTSQPHKRRPMHWLRAAWQNGANIIRFGHQAAAVGFACQTSISITAVRFSQRREMLHRRAKLVRCSRFAPAAKPPVSSSRAAPRRSVSIARSTQAAATNKLHGKSRSACLARQTQAVFNQVKSLPANAANALPNHSLNRTFCGMRQLGFISFSPNCRMPQNAG
jgi:hypothetical protein